LFEQDYRFAGFYDSKNMFFLLYPNYKERVKNIIKKCYNSEDEDLIKVGSHALSEMFLHYNEFEEEMSDVINMNEEQANEILNMTILYFDKNEYNSLAKEIICRFKNSDLDLEMPISRLFFDNRINIERDKEFLIEIMSSSISRGTLHSFINYLEEEANSLVDFSDIIISMSNHLIESISNGIDREYGVDKSLSKLIIGLYDETAGSQKVKEKEISQNCLNLWDKMFEYQIGSVRRLSKEIMER
jgi:hypothetical protein